MAENMYRALWSWIICVVVTVIVSVLTRPKPEKELYGLVYGCTDVPKETDLPWFQKPLFWAGLIIVVFIALNIIFW
jgi:solute:Na+ symporter, SSS family